MTSNPQLTLPADLAELFGDPQRVRDAFAILNALLKLRIVMAVPVVAGGASTLVATKESAVLTLALRYPDGVPADLAGAATLADVITTVNLILAGERAIQTPVSQ